MINLVYLNNLIQYGSASGIEYEAKFLDINVNKIKKEIRKLGAKQVHKRIKMVRSAFDICGDPKKGYSRVRQEYKKTTMTIKTYKNPDFPEEHEIEIKDGFKAGEKFLTELGLPKRAYQESYREKYKLPKYPGVTEIVFDDLPGIPTYMEIDCKDKDTLDKMTKLLKLDETKMRFGAFDRTYEEYYGITRDIINTKTPLLTFKNIKNEIKPTKNEELLDKIAAKQRNW